MSTDDINPMDGLRNLIDLMLVFAVGLLVSLVVSQNAQNSPFQKKTGANMKSRGANAQALQNKKNANANANILQNIQNIRKSRELKEIPQIEKSDGSGYSEMGTVYRDAKTGKLILIEAGKE